MSDWFTFFGWTFLPGLVTNWIQSIYYRTIYRAGDNIPKPGQRKYAVHRKRIYVFVVLAYLIYTVVEVIRSIPPNYYDLLGVTQKFTAKELKTNLRKLELVFHPDRNPGEHAESTFILLRIAYETLNDKTRRFAYDRFGPDINTWEHCKTSRDFISVGLNNLTSFYVGTGLLLLILNVLGKGQFGRFWRFLVFFGMACIESSLILHPNDYSSFFFMKNWVIFERITILRQLFITIFIALSQVGPVLFPSDNNNENLRPKLHELEILSNLANEEIKNQLKSGFHPFQNDQNSQSELKKKMEKLILDSYLYQNDSDYVQTYSKVHQRIVSSRKKNK